MTTIPTPAEAAAKHPPLTEEDLRRVARALYRYNPDNNTTICVRVATLSCTIESLRDALDEKGWSVEMNVRGLSGPHYQITPTKRLL